jgi:hypothetical protein
LLYWDFLIVPNLQSYFNIYIILYNPLLPLLLVCLQVICVFWGVVLFAAQGRGEVSCRLAGSSHELSNLGRHSIDDPCNKLCLLITKRAL